MKKLSLDLDQLTVDSFDTAAPAAEKGTVFGEQCTCYTHCDTCPGCPTCDNTLCGQYTCDTCPDTYNECTYYPCGPTDVADTCNPSYDGVYICCPY
jgi:hypothetical protein